MHWKVSVPRCSLTLAQNVRLCDIFLMRSRISTLLRMDILKEINDPPQGAEPSKPYLECRAGSLPPEPRQLSWYNSVLWLLAELAAVMHSGTSGASHLVHARAGSKSPCFHLSSSLGCEGYSAARYFGYAGKYLPFSSARCFHLQQLPQPLWKGTVIVVPAGSCGWICN